MKFRYGKSVFITSIWIFLITISFSLLIYLFDGAENKTVFCFFYALAGICILLICKTISSRHMIDRIPMAAWFLVSIYMLSLMMICFSNPLIICFSMYFLGAVLLAGLFDGIFANVYLLSMLFLVGILNHGITYTDIIHTIYGILAILTISGINDRKKSVYYFFSNLFLQLLLSLLFSRYTISEYGILNEIITVFLINLMIPFALLIKYHICIPIKELTYKVLETDDSVIKIEEPVSQIECSYSAPDIAMLIRSDYILQKKMKECSQKQFERCEELAVLSGRIAKKVGAKEELTYVAALYCDMAKILQNDITVTSEELARENDFPEELIKIIQEQTEKDALPSSMESAIVLITNNIITMYHFIMKNKKDVSMSKLIENTFQMHLKKGTIRSAGMSMSQYHKIRQEFYSEFKETYHIE